MKTVYVVTSGCYSDYGIDAVFSTKELADRYCEEANKAGKDAGVEDWNLDEDQDLICRSVHYAYVNMSDGSLVNSMERMELGPPRETETVFIDFRDVVYGRSTEGPDHAMKLAAEKRQEILRMRAQGLKEERK